MPPARQCVKRTCSIAECFTICNRTACVDVRHRAVGLPWYTPNLRNAHLRVHGPRCCRRDRSPAPPAGGATGRQRRKWPMARYILGRVLSLVFVLFAVTLITFFLMHAVPGGPFNPSERSLPAATREAQLHKYGLDQPIMIQYVKYVWRVVHFDFEVPFQRQTETVMSLIASRRPSTSKIGMPTIILTYTLGTLF